MQNSPLRGRYKIVKNLGRGGFGETYLAEDLDRPGHPNCVVKKLHATFNSAQDLEVAKRFFNNEAQVLYNLGDRHAQIPRLLAHFEENSEFYLVQDFIEGQDLSQEMASGRKWNETQVISFLKDILKVLEFVHQQNVIHRDIKPANIIRKQDNTLALIDFGAVKEIQTVVHTQSNTHLTVGIGTQGYMPLEQRAGKPRFNSDIYAVGITAIQAITGISPEKLPEDPKTEEVRWREQANVSDRLANILDLMVKSHYRDRYQSVREILQDLDSLTNTHRAKTEPLSSSNQASNSTVISNETKHQSVTTKQPSIIANTASDELKPKRSFGLAIALAVIGAVAATLGATQLVSFLQSKPASQPIAQAPPPPVSVPIQVPIASPSIAPEASPSIIASATPQANPVVAPVLSQGQNVVSLSETNCLTTNASPNYQSFQKLSKDTIKNLTIGQEVVAPVATLSSVNFTNKFGSDIAISPSTPAGVACQINDPNSSSQFHILVLAFGISNTSLYVGQSSKVRLTAYADQKSIGSKEITRGGKQYWNINVTNVQNLALQAECIKGDSYINFRFDDTYGKQFELCPALIFTQANLE